MTCARCRCEHPIVRVWSPEGDDEPIPTCLDCWAELVDGSIAPEDVR